MVISRATSDCQSLAADRTSITAPVVSEARNVMIATTATSARPEMVELGTIGESNVGSSSSAFAGAASISSGLTAGSIVDMQTPPMEDEPARIELVHQRNIVGRDDDGRTGF